MRNLGHWDIGWGYLALAALATSTPSSASGASADISTPIPLCGQEKRVTCVVDGDTLWLHGEKIRIADIDTPEMSRPRCAAERSLANRATLRLQQLLNAGPFDVAPVDRDRDRFGRLLRIVQRNGISLGDQLIREGLARRWDGKRRGWCSA